MMARYVFVNALTLLSASIGVVLITNGQQLSMSAIHLAFAICVVLDGLDGYLARKWQVESTFGKLADCIADFLVFGVALAVVMGQFDVPAQYQVVWVLAAALRLYYFQTVPPRPDLFSGLPLPAAALSVSGVFMISDAVALVSDPVRHVAIIAIASVMFSTITYPKRIGPFAVSAVVAVPLLVMISPPATAFVALVGLSYLVIGMLLAWWSLWNAV